MSSWSQYGRTPASRISVNRVDAAMEKSPANLIRHTADGMVMKIEWGMCSRV
jgi:hypothetical protein